MLGILEHPNWDPVIFTIKEPQLALRWYGLMYVLAFTIGYFILRWLQKIGYLRVKAEDVTNVIVVGVLGTFLGGRLGYLLFYQFDKLVVGKGGHTIGERFSMIYSVWDGGMSFHGGVFGVAIAVIIYAWRRKYSFWNIIDASAHLVPLGVALVRCGNFINGELYGRMITDADGKPVYDEAKLPWYAMKFPTEQTDQNARIQLQRAIERDYLAANPDAADIPNKIYHVPPVKPEVWTQVKEHFPGRYPSQIVQFLFEGVLVLLSIWVLRRFVKKPGQLGGAFLMLYAIFRIPAEMIRQPDGQIDPARAAELGGTAAFLHAIGLTMGQFLSVVIFVIGAVVFVLFQMKKLSGEPYTPEQRRGGFWRDTIRDFPEIIGLRKPKPAAAAVKEDKPAKD